MFLQKLCHCTIFLCLLLLNYSAATVFFYRNPLRKNRQIPFDSCPHAVISIKIKQGFVLEMFWSTTKVDRKSTPNGLLLYTKSWCLSKRQNLNNSCNEGFIYVINRDISFLFMICNWFCEVIDGDTVSFCIQGIEVYIYIFKI